MVSGMIVVACTAVAVMVECEGIINFYSCSLLFTWYTASSSSAAHNTHKINPHSTLSLFQTAEDRWSAVSPLNSREGAGDRGYNPGRIGRGILSYMFFFLVIACVCCDDELIVYYI